MNRHPLDLFSLLSGLLFVTLGFVFLLDEVDAVDVDARWIPAIVLMTLGAAGVASSVTSQRRELSSTQGTESSR